METQEKQDVDRKRPKEQGVVDRKMVVEDLDNTISNLFTYLTSNSPVPQELTSSKDERIIFRDDAVASPRLTHGESTGSITREVTFPASSVTSSAAFRPVPEAGSPRSRLVTPPVAFHPISEGLPPPLPKRGPPIELASNSDLFSSSIDKRYSPAARGSITSRTSPSPSRWITESPFGLRDRKSFMSSVNSKASSDIELVNLFKGDRVNCTTRQSHYNSHERLRPELEESRLIGNPEELSNMASAFNTHPAFTSDHEIGRLGTNVPSELERTRFMKPSSVKDTARSKPSDSTLRIPVQYKPNSESPTNIVLADVSKEPFKRDLQKLSRPSSVSCLSVQSFPLRTTDKVRELDHHYSEIDLYDSAQNNGSTTRTTSVNTVSSTTLSSPPPVPPHTEGERVE
ncbi:uncharacterized protein [Panulirus ornatus]|uniref:uncharacterized protein n=1 Tax=Panulirus ornatus TaxID=150431 RepID=UPI003A852CA1